MDTHANNNPLYQMDNFLMHLPMNRWMLLPFIKKVRPPPNIREIKRLSEIMSISDTNILELLVSNHLVQIRKCKISKKITRIAYIQNETQWNNTVTNGNVTICLDQYSKYEYIYLLQHHTSSHTKHTVADVHHGLIQYTRLITTRVRSRLHLLVPYLFTQQIRNQLLY